MLELKHATSSCYVCVFVVYWVQVSGVVVVFFVYELVVFGPPQLIPHTVTQHTSYIYMCQQYICVSYYYICTQYYICVSYCDTAYRLYMCREYICVSYYIYSRHIYSSMRHICTRLIPHTVTQHTGYIYMCQQYIMRDILLYMYPVLYVFYTTNMQVADFGISRAMDNVYICVSYYYICTIIYVSSYCYICVLILLYMCPHTAICVLILLFACPHTTIQVSSYYYICVRILLHMCPLSSYYYICVLILVCMCPRTTIYVSSYYYICVLILLYVGCGLRYLSRYGQHYGAGEHYDRFSHL